MSEYGRKIKLRIEVDLWKWPAGSLSDTEDITSDVLNYRFQKSIKNPAGSCQISMIPQRTKTHIMDIINPMDVVKIYEFDTLKFVGTVTRISYSGSIGRDGKPNRDATITCQQMGGLFTTASVGLGLGTALGRPSDFLFNAATSLNLNLRNAVADGISFAEITALVIDSFRDYLTELGGQNFATYMDQYIDASTGLAASESPRLPRSFELFSGTEQSVNLWQLLEQMVERPFNELWIDNGPRNVNIEGSNVALPEKACMVFRPTPFNGTAIAGANDAAFDGLPTVNVDRNHLLSFNLSRSMDEVYTMYSVKEAAFMLSDIARLLLGQAVVDEERVGKYLLKPLITELFFTRMETKEGDSQELTEGQMASAAEQSATTLFNWFKNNDLFLSGAISHMVPEDNEEDPKIGQKVSVYGIEGYFYVEGIAHLWNYQGPLRSDLTITRGFNRGERIELKDRIFKGGVVQ